MQTQTFFIDDPKRPDWDRPTSFRVIGEIHGSNIGYFQTVDPAHPGMRACRLARAGDARMAPEDVAAWDRLVVEGLLPAVDAEIATIEREGRQLSGADSGVYARAVALHRQRRAWIERVHGTFMKAYRPYLPAASGYVAVDGPAARSR